jgi:hypothetical protein
MKILQFTKPISLSNLHELESDTIKSGIAILVQQNDENINFVHILNCETDIQNTVLEFVSKEIDTIQVSFLFTDRLIFYPSGHILVLELENISEYVIQHFNDEIKEFFNEERKLTNDDLEIIEQFVSIEFPELIKENFQK